MACISFSQDLPLFGAAGGAIDLEEFDRNLTTPSPKTFAETDPLLSSMAMAQSNEFATDDQLFGETVLDNNVVNQMFDSGVTTTSRQSHELLGETSDLSDFDSRTGSPGSGTSFEYKPSSNCGPVSVLQVASAPLPLPPSRKRVSTVSNAPVAHKRQSTARRNTREPKLNSNYDQYEDDDEMDSYVAAVQRDFGTQNHDRDTDSVVSSSTFGGKAKGNPNSRMANYAREYRAKNKNHVVQLEGRIRALESTKQKLHGQVSQLCGTVRDQATEIDYLRSVLANSSALAPLLRACVNERGTKLSANLDDMAQDSGSKNAGGRKSVRASAKQGAVGAGVCVHVDGQNVSLEFCGRCASKSRESKIRFPAELLVASRHSFVREDRETCNSSMTLDAKQTLVRLVCSEALNESNELASGTRNAILQTGYTTQPDTLTADFDDLIGLAGSLGHTKVGDLMYGLVQTVRKMEVTNMHAQVYSIVASKVLSVLQSDDLSWDDQTNLFERFPLFVKQLTADAKEQLMQSYVQSFESENNMPQKWCDLVAVFLGDVDVNENQLGGDRVINRLLQANWHQNAIGSALLTLKDCGLSAASRALVVHKCLLLFPTVQQHDHFVMVLSELLLFVDQFQTNMFNVVVAVTDRFVEADNRLLQSDEPNQNDHLECSCAALMHLVDKCKHDPLITNKLLEKMREQPIQSYTVFSLALLLALAEIARFKDTALVDVRNLVVHSLRQQEQMDTSLWLHTTMHKAAHSSAVRIRQLLLCIANKCMFAFGDVLDKSLCSLGLSMIELHVWRVSIACGHIVPSTKAPALACQLGTQLITLCFQKQDVLIGGEMIDAVLQAVLDRSTKDTVFYYIHLLQSLVLVGVVQARSQQARVLSSIELLSQLRPSVAGALLRALMPVIVSDHTLQHALFRVLKRATFQRRVCCRLIGADGLLLYMKHVQLYSAIQTPTNTTALNSSQGTQSFPTFTSSQMEPMMEQNTMNAELDVEKRALSLEAIACLRRGLSQNAQVRTLIYKGLFDAAYRSADLLEPVSELLLRQLRQYVTVDSDTGQYSLSLLNVVQQVDGQVQLTEPLADLLHAVFRCARLSAERSHGLDGVVGADVELSADMYNDTVPCSARTLLVALTKAVANTTLELLQLGKANDWSDVAVAHRALVLLACLDTFVEIGWWFMHSLQSAAKVLLIEQLVQLRAQLLAVLAEKKVNVANLSRKTAANENDEVKKAAHMKVVQANDNGPAIQMRTLRCIWQHLLSDGSELHEPALSVLRGLDEPDVQAKDNLFVQWLLAVTSHKLKLLLKTPDLDGQGTHTHMQYTSSTLLTFFTSAPNELIELWTVEPACSLYALMKPVVAQLYASLVQILTTFYPDQIVHWLSLIKLEMRRSRPSANDTTLQTLIDQADKEVLLARHIRALIRFVREHLCLLSVQQDDTPATGTRKKRRAHVPSGVLDKTMEKVLLAVLNTVQLLCGQFTNGESQSFLGVYKSLVLLAAESAEISVSANLVRVLFGVVFECDLRLVKRAGADTDIENEHMGSALLTRVAKQIQLCLGQHANAKLPQTQQRENATFLGVSEVSACALAVQLCTHLQVIINHVQYACDALSAYKADSKTQSVASQSEQMSVIVTECSCMLSALVPCLALLHTTRTMNDAANDNMLKATRLFFTVAGNLTKKMYLMNRLRDKAAVRVPRKYRQLLVQVADELLAKTDACVGVTDCWSEEDRVVRGSKQLFAYARAREQYTCELAKLSTITNNQHVLYAAQHLSANRNFKVDEEKLRQLIDERERNEEDDTEENEASLLDQTMPHENDTSVEANPAPAKKRARTK